MSLKKIFVIFFLIALALPIANAQSVGVLDRAINVKENGVLVAKANLSLYVYTAASGGNLIYQENFTNAVKDGVWGVILGKNSQSYNFTYGDTYYSDYEINGNDVDFIDATGATINRREWINIYGVIPPSFYNTSYIVYKNSTSVINNASLDCSNIVGGSDSDFCSDAAGGAASTIPATNISSGLFGSAIGNNSFNFTALSVVGNLTLFANGNLSLPTNSILDIFVNTLAADKLFNLSFLNNKIQIDASNVSSGTINSGRYDMTFLINKNGTASIANASISCSNITGATSNLCTVSGGGSAMNVTNDTAIVTQNPTALNFSSSEFTLASFGSVARIIINLIDASKLSNIASLSNKITSDAANITSGTLAQARIPDQSSLHVHDTANITSGAFGDNRITNASTWHAKAGTGSQQCSGTDKVSNVTVTSSGISVVCTTDVTGGGGSSTLPATNISSGLFGSAIGNNSFNFTALSVVGNLTLFANGNLSLPTNSILDIFVNTLAADKLFNVSYLSNKVQSDAANITSGVFALARIPQINDTHTHNPRNITAGTFVGGYNISGNLNITGTLAFNNTDSNSGIKLGNATISWNGTSLIIKVT